MECLVLQTMLNDFCTIVFPRCRTAFSAWFLVARGVNCVSSYGLWPGCSTRWRCLILWDLWRKPSVIFFLWSTLGEDLNFSSERQHMLKYKHCNYQEVNFSKGLDRLCGESHVWRKPWIASVSRSWQKHLQAVERQVGEMPVALSSWNPECYS